MNHKFRLMTNTGLIIQKHEGAIETIRALCQGMIVPEKHKASLAISGQNPYLRFGPGEKVVIP